MSHVDPPTDTIVTGTAQTDVVLDVRNLSKRFGGGRSGLFSRKAGRAPVVAVDDVSFTVARGETLGIVGESGCGKSTLVRSVLRLVKPSSGTVEFDGVDVGSLSDEQMRQLRSRLQIVFQDPFGSLDPRMSALQLVREPLDVHKVGDADSRDPRAAEMLEMVGIPRDQHNRRPYAFSGGQRQRIGIARAMVVQPELVFLDEPVSALDVSIQAQVLNLLTRLREEFGLSYVFIVHDLAVAEYFCDRVLVLYRGAVMETGSAETLFKSPMHPYTTALLSAVPVPDPVLAKKRNQLVLGGQVTPLGPESEGCRFRERCPIGKDRELCANVEPPLSEHPGGHQVACHFAGELAFETAGAQSSH